MITPDGKDVPVKVIGKDKLLRSLVFTAFPKDVTLKPVMVVPRLDAVTSE
jgi:hypothetical protein